MPVLRGQVPRLAFDPVELAEAGDERDGPTVAVPERPVERAPRVGGASDAHQVRDDFLEGVIHLVGVGLDGAGKVGELGVRGVAPAGALEVQDRRRRREPHRTRGNPGRTCP